METGSLFSEFILWIEHLKKQHLIKNINICIKNIFSVIFDQFNASLLNKSINLFTKKCINK